jgi:hypothetical protein
MHRVVPKLKFRVEDLRGFNIVHPGANFSDMRGFKKRSQNEILVKEKYRECLCEGRDIKWEGQQVSLKA